MLKLGVQQAEDIAKGVCPVRDVHPPVQGLWPMVVQTGRPGPRPYEAEPVFRPRPSGLGGVRVLPQLVRANSAGVPAPARGGGGVPRRHLRGPASGRWKELRKTELIGGSSRKG